MSRARVYSIWMSCSSLLALWNSDICAQKHRPVRFPIHSTTVSSDQSANGERLEAIHASCICLPEVMPL